MSRATWMEQSFQWILSDWNTAYYGGAKQLVAGRSNWSLETRNFAVGRDWAAVRGIGLDGSVVEIFTLRPIVGRSVLYVHASSCLRLSCAHPHSSS